MTNDITTGDWTSHIRQECFGNEVRFDLPVRPLGWLRLVGVVVIVFDVACITFPLRALWEICSKALADGVEPLEAIPIIFLVAFLVATAMPLLVGLAILFGRSRVEWKDGRLRSTEIIGPIRWLRRLPRKPIRKLVVNTGTTQNRNGAPSEPGLFGVLQAEFEDGTKKIVVLGYPKDWLLGLAQELSSYVGAEAVAISTPPVENT